MDCPKCSRDRVPEGDHSCPECETPILTAPKPAAQIEVTQQVGTVEGGQLVGVDLGEVLGDVSIGNYTLRIGTLNGGVVNIAAPQPQQQLPQARPAPVRLIPRKSAGLLDRKQETSVATSTLLSASPAEFHGPPGIGKTKLLRHLAYEQFDSACPDGVVYLAAVRHKPVEDVLLDIFDAFYEREATYKPTAVQVRHSLQDKQALIILDDVDLERDEVAALMDAAPGCTFLLASAQCCLWGEGRALALQGLPLVDALSLIERELGRSLSANERPGAEALCTALQGHPLRLQQVAALVREDDRSLVDLSAQLRQQEKAGLSAKALTDQALAACSEQEKQILAVLAISRGASLGRDHVRALTGIEDIDPPIESLKRRKLAQSHSPRYSLTGSLGSTLEEEWDLTSWNEQALEHFAAWAEQHRQNPRLVTEETDAILGILSWALQEGRWEGALRLGRAVEGALAVGGQWGAWAQVLSWQFQAARELGDRAAQAWALHQSGTRGLCLNHPPTAQTDLSEALRIRESLEDWAGAAVTRHNLEVFFGGPGGTSGPQGDGNGSGGGGGWLPRLPLWQWLTAVVAALVVLGLSTSAIVGRPLPLSPKDALEPTAEWVPEPVAQLLQPARQVLQPTVQLLEAATQPASNPDTLPSTPWSKPDTKSGDTSDPASGSGTKSGDGSDSSASSTKPSGDSGSGGSDTESGDDGNGSSGSDSGDSPTEPDEEGSATGESDTEPGEDGSVSGDSDANHPGAPSTEIEIPSTPPKSTPTEPTPTEPTPTEPTPTEPTPTEPTPTEPTPPESTPTTQPDPEGTIDYGGCACPEAPGSGGPIVR
jgi:hypothetical protein